MSRFPSLRCLERVFAASALLVSLPDSAPAQVGSEQKISDLSGGFTGTLLDGDRFGSSVVSLGDLDGDGVEDMAVGAHSDDDGATNAGAVWVLFMNSDGTVKSQQKISAFTGGFGGGLSGGDSFGRSLTCLGDLDGNGIVELAVGAHRDDDFATNAGAVWILFLRANGTVRLKQKISSTQGGFPVNLASEDRFGRSLATLDDLDGDGLPELAVGAHRDDDGTGNNLGAVWIVFLNSSGTVKSAQKISATSGGLGGVLSDDDQFGAALATASDLNGDGRRELVVGANRDDDGGADRGAVWILFLRANGTVKQKQKISSTSGNFGGSLTDGGRFGTSLAWLTDASVGGGGELVVGAYQASTGGPQRGEIWIVPVGYDGQASSQRQVSSLIGGLTSPLDDNDWFGRAVGALGDVDGNGTRDLVVGSVLDDDGGTDRGAAYLLRRNVDGDLNGCWHVFSHFDDIAGNEPGWERATWCVDFDGDLIGGRAMDQDGDQGAIAGDQLDLAGPGFLSGTLADAGGGSQTFSDFQLEPENGLFAGVVTDLDGFRALAVALKAGGLFSPADLTGTWYFYGRWDLGSFNDPGWDRGSFTVNAAGVVTAGSIVDSDGGSTSLVGLQLDLDDEGLLSVTGVPLGPFKLSRSKNLAVSVDTDTADYRALNILVKGGGAFTNADLEGPWVVASYYDDPSVNAPGWIRETFRVNSTGTITSGSALDSDGLTDTLLSGSLNINAQGLVSGTLNWSQMGTELFSQYKLDPARRVLVGTNTDSQGCRSLGVAIKQPTWADVGRAHPGARGLPRLTASGVLTPGNVYQLDLTHAPQSALGFWIGGLSTIYLPFKDGVMVPSIDTIFPIPTDPSGEVHAQVAWPTGIPADTSFYLQVWVVDANASRGMAASNALSATTR